MTKVCKVSSCLIVEKLLLMDLSFKKNLQNVSALCIYCFEHKSTCTIKRFYILIIPCLEVNVFPGDYLSNTVIMAQLVGSRTVGSPFFIQTYHYGPKPQFNHSNIIALWIENLGHQNMYNTHTCTENVHFLVLLFYTSKLNSLNYFKTVFLLFECFYKCMLIYD